jgi:predicted ATPase/DNA-binding SARP family transcriptional activator
MPTLRITLAGNVIVEVDGRRLADEALGPRGRIVLACLVLERHRLLPVGELAEATWGIDLPPTWRPALRGTLTRVRRFLDLPRPDGAIVLENRLGCYQLTVPDDAEVDVEQAVAEHEAAKDALLAGDHLRAMESARTSAGLCRHEFLPGTSGAWVENHQLRLGNLYVASLDIASQAAAALGEWDLARETAEEILGRDPYCEPAYVLLMNALAGGGNVSEAMRVYKRCCDVLEQELGAPPSPPTREAFLTLMRKAESVEGDDPRPLTNLPAALSTFVGRTERVVALRARLTSARLVTLVGMAGVGKSRLAVEATRPMTASVGDGVWLVELAEVSAGVGRHVAAALRLADIPGRDAMESLCEQLARKEMLLVLDNCEHVHAESAEVARRLLGACPGVRILATSREPLHLAGEVTWPVEPLSLPAPLSGGRSVDYFNSEAVQLFADRASSARPGLDVDLDAVADVCVRLDGIPLAIELAAAHARVFSVGELRTLLAEHPELVTRSASHGATGRHGSLAAALDWSYERLGEDERAVLRRLSPFAGGFTAEAAEWICSDLTLDALGVLTNLVDKSLVAARQGETTRFRLLETVRAYGWTRLAEADEEDHARSRHLDWAHALARASSDKLRLASQADVLDRLDAERGNLDSALRWSVDSNQEQRGLELAIALARYWDIRGYLDEGRSWLERLAGSDRVTPESRAAALDAAGILANHQSDFASARAMHAEALVVRRSLGDLRTVAASLNGLASVAVSAGEYDAARPLFEEILEIGRRLRDGDVTATCLVNLAAVTEHAHEEDVAWPYSLADAREWLLEASTILRQAGDLRGVAQTLENLGVVSAMEGHQERAHNYFRQCLDLYRQLGDKMGVAGTVRFLGQLSYLDGDYERAKQLLEECLSLERQLGSVQRVAEALGFLGTIAEGAGQVADARALYRESLATYARAGNPTRADDVLRRLLDLEPLSDTEAAIRRP